jgi:hypothetical protein
VRRFEGALAAGDGDGDSQLSVDDRFIDEYGLCVLRLPLGDANPPVCFNRSRAAAAGFGEAAAV